MQDSGTYFYSLDKLIYSKIGTAETLPSGKKIISGSILNIKNLKFSIILWNNTFSSNVGFSGTSLYINGYESGSLSPILIKENYFDNNFAFSYGLSIVILNHEISIY